MDFGYWYNPNFMSEVRISRRLGAIGAGTAAMMALGGCGPSETVSPTPTAEATQKPVELYDHRVAVVRDENLIVCFTDEEPFDDDVRWAFVADQAYCPDTKANMIFLKEEGPVISPFRLDIIRGRDYFEHSNQAKFRNDGVEIPPPFFGLLPEE